MPRPTPAAPANPGAATGAGGGPTPSRPDSPGPRTEQAAAGPLTAEDEELAAHLEELRSQLLATPAEVVVANHAYGLFELAAIHLSQRPPQLGEARLAIDAMGAMVEGLSGRLGDAEPSLRDALAQIRVAYVQIGDHMSAGAATPVEGAQGTAPATS